MDEAHSFAELMWRIVGVVVVVFVISLAIRIWRGYRRGHHRAPRARASWLRRFRRSSRTGAATERK